MEGGNSQRKGSNHYIPNDLLNDLSSRFIINVPEEERVDLIRLCFQIELAHWFYLDFYCDENPKLPKTGLRDFQKIIFGHIPFLKRYTAAEVETILSNWREYKKAVPTFGAILLDKELKNVLLVQSFVYKTSWGFPKGKVNKDEKAHHCAIREVLEETGFDITDLIDKENYLEYSFNDQLIRLYIITDVPTDADFQPQTRNEIKGCEWFVVNHLPTMKNEQNVNSLKPNNFFMVIPFVKQLKKWISNRTREIEKQAVRKMHLSSQPIKNEFAKYPEGTSPAEQRVRQKKNIYSPPPRMMKAKANHQQSDDRNATPPKFHKKNTTDSSKSSKKSLHENNPFISKTWQNFSLDCEHLIATFNISMRQTSVLKKPFQA